MCLHVRGDRPDFAVTSFAACTEDDWLAPPSHFPYRCPESIVHDEAVVLTVTQHTDDCGILC